MRIAVVGAGAMGSIFGARFKEAGHDAVLVDVAPALVAKDPRVVEVYLGESTAG